VKLEQERIEPLYKLYPSLLFSYGTFKAAILDLMMSGALATPTPNQAKRRISNEVVGNLLVFRFTGWRRPAVVCFCRYRFCGGGEGEGAGG
jgi:hypothetical protein